MKEKSITKRFRRDRETAYAYTELAPMRHRRIPQPLSLEGARVFTELTEYSQQYIEKRLRKIWETRNRRQWPLDKLHREMRSAGLLHCSVNIDPPNWIDVYEYSEPPRTVKDKYGRVLYMTKGIKEVKKIRPEDFAPVARFESAFPMHPNPAVATYEEKERRIAAFLNAYASTGLATASATYVGVNYFQLVLWVNENPEWQAQFVVAEEAAKLVMVDIGKQRAMMGDTGLLRFFIERDNPEKYGRGRRKDVGELPEGVTGESVASALAMIAKAQGDSMARVEPLPEAIPERDPSEFPAALVNQTTPSIFHPPSPSVITIDGEN